MELVRNSFSGICDEMAESLVRSSHSPNIKERRDCSCCLYTARGEIVVQAEHIPVHLGVMATALPHVLLDFPPEEMAPGDVFIVNDPYHGANHLPDFIVAGPLFAEGRLIGFAASMAHHTDVGGMAPRSMPAGATEIFHEGLRLPPVRLASAGRVDPGLRRVIAANSRLPEERLADLDAQIATIEVAQRRIDELTQRYSADDLLAAAARILDMAEAATRRVVAGLPRGTLRGQALADYGPTTIPIRVALTPREDVLEVDFSGTGDQVVGPFNSCLSATLACVFMAVRITLGEGIPANAGMYRALHITAPDGSILNPRYPTAISAAAQVSYHTFEALLDALAPLYPERVLAGSGGGGVFSLGGTDPRTGRLFAYGEALGGGSGASCVADGESGMIPPIANLHDTPVELLEMSLPMRIERYEIVEDSGGAGRFRGGFGLRRAFRLLTSARCSFQVSMPTRGPAGLDGGEPGAPTRIRIVGPDGTTRRVDRFMDLFAPEGSLIEIETAGGGGYGRPEERDPEALASDLRAGYGRRRVEGEAA
ncbi:hydantoinase B/oxoprolinase family protein [Ancylobacter mangrovi]|uniref:hydantoinase B/oxoprolinase family protein n=1 Tax=Ancylobacter mangrovi TaxID=2972472 RepID=UPI0021633D3C|nr:hydantoinase B/oxoprolinase family protein [Ancylobacter mangrovi]MCS0502164.1 hydantoinase B/oxoprolinase family protein [Ancylobacter mangrovi]